MTTANAAATTIPRPKDDSEVKRFLAAVTRHKDTKEYRIRVTGLLAEVEARGGKFVTQWSWLRHGSIPQMGQKRRELHSRIVDSLLDSDSRCRTKTPIAIVLLGPPGAGKTTVGLPFAKSRHSVAFTSINPDDVKEKLPEYEGWNASALHEESSYVSEAMTKTNAINGRCHIVYDITGKSPDKVKLAVKELGDYGYGVYLLLLDLPPWQAAGRVWERFQKNPFGQVDPSAPVSRYVDPKYVYESVADWPQKTYTQLRRHPAVAGYCRIDAMKSTKRKLVILEEKGW